MRELMIAMGLISLAIGCGSGGGGGGGGGGGSGGSVVAPNDGQWEIGLFELDTDCSNLFPSDPDTETDTADITMDVDGNGLTILNEDGASMHFTLNGTTFESDDISALAPTPFHADGINATFYVDQTLGVEFSSPTQGIIATQIDSSCVGDDAAGVTFCETTDFEGWGYVPCTIINEAPMTAL